MADPRPVSVTRVERGGHGCLVTLLWFIFIGWWLSAIWIAIAWVLVVLIIPMPIGLKMINMLPKIATLREPTEVVQTTFDGINTSVQRTGIRQLPFLLRRTLMSFPMWPFSVKPWLTAIRSARWSGKKST